MVARRPRCQWSQGKRAEPCLCEGVCAVITPLTGRMLCAASAQPLMTTPKTLPPPLHPSHPSPLPLSPGKQRIIAVHRL